MRPYERHEPHHLFLLLLRPLEANEELCPGHDVDYEDEEKAT